MENLYTEAFIKSLPILNNFRNPEVVYLCKSDREFAINHRRQIEKWFSNIPKNTNRDYLSRLRSLDNRQFLSTFYELLLHQYFIEEDLKLDIHPALGKNTPDFLVNDCKGEPLFYLEVATVFQDKTSEIQKNNLYAFVTEASKINHFFRVVFKFESFPESGVSYKKVLVRVKDWLDRLEVLRDENTTNTRPKIEQGKFCFELEIMPGGKRELGSIVGMILEPGYAGSLLSKQIDRALKSKIEKYKKIKEVEVPLLISICSDGGLSTDEYNLEASLFGQEKLIWNAGELDSSRWSRERKGLWVPNRKYGGARNKRVSAILFCRRQAERNRYAYIMKLYHNPWANKKLDYKCFDKLPQLVFYEENERIASKWINNDNRLIYFEN